MKTKICVHLSKGKKANLKVYKELDFSKRDRLGHIFNSSIEHSIGLPFLLIVYLILHFSYVWLNPIPSAMRENGAAWGGCLLGGIWVKEKGEVREEENSLPLV